MSEYVDCRECNTECARADGNYGYTFCSCFTHKKKPMTNADRIRAMEGEKLAGFLAGVAGDKIGGTAKYWLQWLQQPAEEDDHVV